MENTQLVLTKCHSLTVNQNDLISEFKPAIVSGIYQFPGV
jgi:hypothetical protein